MSQKWWLQRVFLEDKKGCTKIKTKKAKSPSNLSMRGLD
jgi:hypothetical protein